MSVAQLARGRVGSVTRGAARRSPLLMLSIGIVAVVAIVAVIGPFIAPYDPTELAVGASLQPVSFAHPFGTDDLGRDIFSRVLVGARASLVAPIVVVVASTLLGVAVGIAGAWYGGVVDAVLARATEVIFAIPGLVLAIMSVAMFGKGLAAPVIALSIAYIPLVARLTRTMAGSELSKPYMDALWINGVSGTAIIVKHLVPTLLPTLAAQSTIGFGYAMLDLSAISYLGLGQQPPAADWGVMVSDGQSSILSGAPEQSLFAALLIVVTVLAVNVLGARATDWAEGGER